MITMPITEIFCDIDDFYKGFSENNSAHVLPNPNRQRCRQSQLVAREIMCILILFHLSHYRTVKDFYIDCVCADLKSFFPNLVPILAFLEFNPVYEWF